MIKILFPAILLGLGGCSTISSLTTPSALQSGATVIACDIAMSSAAALRIEDAIKAKQAVIDATGNVYTVSSTACMVLGGTVKGLTLLP